MWIAMAAISRARFCAGILAGGRGERMGAEKALLDAGGLPMLERQLSILRPIADELLVASGAERKYEEFGARVVTDTYTPGCALAGVHALLAAARYDAVFVCACDQPYLNPALILHLVGHLPGFDAVVPVGRRGIEPLHAVYTRRCLEPIEEAFRNGRLAVAALPALCRTKRLEIREGDWSVLGASPFTNLNSPEDLAEFRQKLATREPAPGTSP
jgi:molybdopterin-guanine dinucleotide biosynthesis protein A